VNGNVTAARSGEWPNIFQMLLVSDVVSREVIACNALQFLCNNCSPSNAMENVHFRLTDIFHHVGKPALLLHKNCSALLAINCTWNHGISDAAGAMQPRRKGECTLY